VFLVHILLYGEKPGEILKNLCFHYTNLQPFDKLSKGCKLL